MDLPLMVCIFAEMTWRLTFNDPYLLAWMITLAHFAASYFCFSAGRRQFSASTGKGIFRSALFWPLLGVILAGLALNKQLDLQTLLTVWGRQAAKAGGWYAQRRYYQSLFVSMCVLVGCACALAGFILVRGHWRDRGVAFLGLIFLLTFVSIRAASFHHIDMFLYRHPVIGNWMNAGLELGGALLVILGAILARRKQRTA